MHENARDRYLTDQVLTATPQRLQLMLIEGAIRFALQAREHWRHRRDVDADNALVRSQEILTQMLCNLNPEGDRELVRRIASVYLFIFRSLTAAHLQRDEAKLDEALRVLETERETWRQVCGQHVDVAPHMNVSTMGHSFVA